MSAFKRRRAEFETPHCPSCDSTNVVTDNRQGHLVCDDCGVILQSSMISTATEYRNFSESDKPTGDPTRVSAGPLGTSMAQGDGDRRKFSRSRGGDASEERFRAAFKQITDIVAKLQLDQDVRDQAQELYRMYAQTREKVSDVKSTAAAAVFLATKECKCERTIKEINKVVDPTKNLKNPIGKASRELTRVMQERLQEECMRRGIDPSDMGAVRQMVMGGTGNIYGGVDERTSNHPSQQVPRFGSDLGFSPRGVQIAIKISKLILPDDLSVNIEHKSWHGKQPTTLTAVTLYIATHLDSRVMSPGVPVRTLSEVADVCGVSAATVEATYAELHSELRDMLPPLRPPLTEGAIGGIPSSSFEAHGQTTGRMMRDLSSLREYG